MIWVPMLAKYPGECAFCTHPIKRGDSIRYAKKTYEAVHNACFKKKYGKRKQ